MRSTRLAAMLLPLALAACNPEDVSKMMDDASSSVAHSTVVIDLEAEGDAMMEKDDAMMAKSSSDDAMMDKEGAMAAASTAASPAAQASAAAAATAGAYLAYDADVLKDGQTKVLFFHAAWCPICRAQDTELTAWYGRSDASFVNTYKVDYDSEKALKAVYGVTYQHTFVKVDGQGTLIGKIQGPTDEQLTTLLTR